MSSVRKQYEHSEAFLLKQRTQQEAFLLALRKNKGRVLVSCDEAHVSFDAVLDWREDEKSDFNKRFLRAMQILPTAALDEAIRRGLEGYEGKPITYKGEILREMKEYSDAMLTNVLRAHDKRFRSGIDIEEGEGGAKFVVNLTKYA